MTASFSWYYFWANVGQLAGELGGPLLRQYVSVTACIASISGSCTAAAVLFVAGSRYYSMRPPVRTTMRSSLSELKRDLRELLPIVKVRGWQRHRRPSAWPSDAKPATRLCR